MAKTSTSVSAFLAQIESTFKGSTCFEQGNVPKNIPRSLAEWRVAEGGVAKFGYSFTVDKKSIFGGIEFRSMKGLKADCQSWADDTWVADDKEQKRIWDPAVPFCVLHTGDFLAFSEPTEDDAPIVYLSHDDESRTIAKSFREFVQEWKRIGFLGPESWMLDPFLDPESGYLRHNTEAGKQWLAVFRQHKIHLPE